MRFAIRHRTTYTYSQPVFLEPHLVRLRPRCDGVQSLDEYALTVTPEPAGRCDGLDAEGNAATWLWFEETTDTLEIAAESVVETRRANPFDYIVTSPETAVVPAAYPPWEETLLGGYRKSAGSGPVADLSRLIAEKAGKDTREFLWELTLHLNRHWEVVVREEGEPMEPARTLEENQASCRDLAELYLAACREAGLAGRFVSGYQRGDQDQARRDMHAWAEVYLPGGGWRGYDPTLGLAVSDGHVALAASATPRGAAPTLGTFRGTDATASLSVALEIEAE